MTEVLGKQIQAIRPLNILGSIPPYVEGGGGAEEVTDNFNRSDGSLIASPGKYCSDGVHEWALLTGANLLIVSNQVSVSYTSAAGAYISNMTPAADMTVQVKITAQIYSNHRIQLMGRLSSDYNNCYMLYLTQRDILVYKRVGGSFTKISSSKPYFTTNSVVKMVLSGSSIKVYRDDSLVHDLTDSDVTDAGYAGLYITANVYKVDDFYVLTA